MSGSPSSVNRVFDDCERPSISLPPPTSTRTHQRSRTTTELPPLFPRTKSTSPERLSTFLPFQRLSRTSSPERDSLSIVGSETSDLASSARPKTGTVGKIASWFEGSSEPVNISFVPSPRKELQDPFYQAEATESIAMDSSDNLTPRLTKRSSGVLATANSSRFSFFKRAAPPQPKIQSDDLAQMDIKEALMSEPIEEPTWDAFNKLQQNAEQLLKTFQLSYVDSVGALRQVTSDKNVQADELDAAQTKNEHLKLQLLDMAERAAEYERTITELREDLGRHQQSIRMVHEDEPNPPQRRRRNRDSDASSADSMADSEMSSAISIFSEANSFQSSAPSMAPSPVMKSASLHMPAFKFGSTVKSHTTPVLVSDCSNCHGMSRSEAWDVISIMRMESVALKQRITELEHAQDAALDLLSGLSI